MKNRALHLLARTKRARFVHALVLTRVVVGAFLLSGCVSATRHEEVVSAHDVEKEGRRRAEVALEAAERKVAALEASRAELERKARAGEETRAEAELAATVTGKERDQQLELVTQLRGELARVGEHLKSYVGEKDVLTEEKVALEIELAQARDEALRLRARLVDLEKSHDPGPNPDATLAQAMSDLEKLDAEKAEAKDTESKGAESSAPAGEGAGDGESSDTN